MTIQLEDVKNPKFKDGTHVMFLSHKGDPKQGFTKGVVLHTRYNNSKNRNQVFIKSFAYTMPSQPCIWSPMLAGAKIIREESECITIPNVL